MRSEPVVLRSAVVAASAAVLHVAIVVGWISVAPDVETQIVGALDLVAAVVAVAWARSGVFPKDKVAAYVSDAAVEIVHHGEPVFDADGAAHIPAYSIPGQIVAGPASVIPDGTPVAVDTPPGPAVNRIDDAEPV